MLNVSYQFEMPSHSRSIIKVLGVGGGGGNAVKYMYNLGIKDVEFVVCNTDVQALKASPIANKLQIGAHLTEGYGAGTDPEKGRKSAIESREEVREYLLRDDTKMVFITAGMGGGTGTGAAPIIAAIARDLGILTVGIVTTPFHFEGDRKRITAEVGLAEMRKHCDTLIVINNEKLLATYPGLAFRSAFNKADEVLCNAAKSIAEIITYTGDINVDFNDVKNVLKDSGIAIMGSAEASGSNRAVEAIELATASPLLDSVQLQGARKVLLSISFSEDCELMTEEFKKIDEYIQKRLGPDSELKFGYFINNNLSDRIAITIIATGFDAVEPAADENPWTNDVTHKKVIDLDSQRVTNYVNEKPVDEKHDINKPVIKKTDPAVNEVKLESKGSKITFDLPVNHEDKGAKDHATPIKKNVQPSLFDDSEDENNTERELMERSRERKERLRALSEGLNYANDEVLKRLIDVPAYMRKNVSLNDTPHSSESNISRFNLNDDNELLGNNKFLHDNVD